MSLETNSDEKQQRFAIYTRYSSEMQSDLSLEAQEAYCREAIAKRGGVVVAVYSDSAKTGWSLERDGFNELRMAAERGKFDAVMFWKFDRLARSHDHAVMIKMLLRHEYGLKLYCVEGFSEDENNSAYTSMMEQMLAVFSAFYSKNLSSETKRGKKHRASNGEFNGSIAPIGYDLVTSIHATPDRPAGLYIRPRVAAIVRRAFRLYATGNYSDADIAHWMNQRPILQNLRAGRLPINKEMVRDMLQNRVYTGRVRHTDTIYNGSLGERKASKRHRGEWFEGKHEGFISDDLFEACQSARAGMVRPRHSSSKERVYLLFDRVFCARCISNKSDALADDNYGRMRPKFQKQRGYGYYRCLSHDRGYEKCGQIQVPTHEIDIQVVEILSSMVIPDGFKERVEMAVRNRVENAAALQCMEEIKEIVGRIDFRWEQGFISKEEYVEKRRKLDSEINSLRPIDYDELIEAADLIANFRKYWDSCESVEEIEVARQQLLSKIVERVFVYDSKVIALALYGDFGVILDKNETASYSVAEAIAGNLLANDQLETDSSHFGIDGIRTRDLCLDRAVC
jgi:DNA invertase Pin-like site-specific DNA recombinase